MRCVLNYNYTQHTAPARTQLSLGRPLPCPDTKTIPAPGTWHLAQVIVMGATNRRDILDPALTRPGRFDRIVYVPLPDYNGRIEIMQVGVGGGRWGHECGFASVWWGGCGTGAVAGDGRESLVSVPCRTTTQVHLAKRGHSDDIDLPELAFETK